MRIHSEQSYRKYMFNGKCKEEATSYRVSRCNVGPIYIGNRM